MRSGEVEQLAADHVRKQVARGRDACQTIVADTVEYLHGFGEPYALRALAWRLVAPAFTEHLAAQSRWPERTDGDRLTDAFRSLDAAGIVAREDFTCCQSCGLGEIGGEVIPSAPARGYVFYHQQDTDRAIAGDGVWLAFGRFEQPPTVEIGEEIAAALQAQGLSVDWDGSPTQRIHVPVTWARRRHGRRAAFIGGEALDPMVRVEVCQGRYRLDSPTPAAVLTQLELPWLPAGVAVRVDTERGAMTVTRQQHRLVCDDGRSAGRFDAMRLLAGGHDPEPPGEPGLLEVTFEHRPSGLVESAARPMFLPEALEVLRRLPTRTGSWLCAVSASSGVVQLALDDGRLWLETPDPQTSTSTGKHANLDEAIGVLAILATENRVAIAELDGVTTQPW